jgi:hypothetical protein
VRGCSGRRGSCGLGERRPRLTTRPGLLLLTCVKLGRGRPSGPRLWGRGGGTRRLGSGGSVAYRSTSSSRSTSRSMMCCLSHLSSPPTESKRQGLSQPQHPITETSASHDRGALSPPPPTQSQVAASGNRDRQQEELERSGAAVRRYAENCLDKVHGHFPSSFPCSHWRRQVKPDLPSLQSHRHRSSQTPTRGRSCCCSRR